MHVLNAVPTFLSQNQLVILGFLMIVAFMALIMTKRMTPLVALILVPTIFGLFAGAGLGLGEMVMKSLSSMVSTAALLMFAIMYFGMMIDVGLFDPLVKVILKFLGNDPAKVVIGTGLLAGAVSLDGDGSTTFIIVTAAMLPIYLRLGMSPVVLTCVAGMVNGTTNIVPWGGPTARAAAALHVDANAIFLPMLPAMIAGLLVAFGFAWMLGVQERNRLRLSHPVAWGEDGNAMNDDGTGIERSALGQRVGKLTRASRRVAAVPVAPVALDPALSAATAGSAASSGSAGGTGLDDTMEGTALDPNRPTLRPRLIWFNLALSVTVMVFLVGNWLPLPYVFIIATALGLLINFPRVGSQAKEIVAHAPSIVGVVSMVMAAGVLTGVLSGTGMMDAMSTWVSSVIPSSMGPYLALIAGLLSIPMTFFMSNDAFYFGVLPVLSKTAEGYGIHPVEMARASVTGQPVHLQSPLVPAILLLVSLANVDLGEHHKKVLWRTLVISLVMLLVGILTRAIPIG